MVERRDGKRVNGSRRKKRVTTLNDGNDAHPAFAIARNRSGKDRHVAGAVIARVPQKKMIREGGADNLAVVPVVLLILEARESCMFCDGRFRIGKQQPILLRKLVRGTK